MSHGSAVHLTQAAGKDRLALPQLSACSLLVCWSLSWALPFSVSLTSLPPSPPSPVQVITGPWLDFVADINLSTKGSFTGLQGVELLSGLCSPRPLWCQKPFFKKAPCSCLPRTLEISLHLRSFGSLWALTPSLLLYVPITRSTKDASPATGFLATEVSF